MSRLTILIVFWAVLIHRLVRAAGDPLPSWNDGAVKTTCLPSSSHVTKVDGSDFNPAAERIAIFDNDSTFWSEHRVYFQLRLSLDWVEALAPQHPEWKTKQPFNAVLEGDRKIFAVGGEQAFLDATAVNHTGMTTDEGAHRQRKDPHRA